MEILRFLRFDIKSSRSERLANDKFALASDLWIPFMVNCGKCYNPGETLTADEQLFPTKSRCPFTQFMGNKPDKYGIKFFLLVDADSKYVCTGFPYLGKDVQRPPNQTLADSVVMRLMESYLDKGYNLVLDSFFTSLPTAEKLLARKTSVVGTIRQNRRELPDVCALMKDEPVFASKLLVCDSGCTLTICKCKPSKIVCLLSTLHDRIPVQADGKRKPDTILVYNKGKCGVDSVDQMCKMYSTKAGSRRWPLAVFFNVLDLASVNAKILYSEVSK
jgi:hypothetical protein